MKLCDRHWAFRLLLISSIQLVAADSAVRQSRITFALPFDPYRLGFRNVQLLDSSPTVVASDSTGERRAWRPRRLR